MMLRKAVVIAGMLCAVGGLCTTAYTAWQYAGVDGMGVGCIESSPTVYAGNVYVGTSWHGNIHWLPIVTFLALDAETGELLWARELDHEVRATAAAADGALFVGEDTGHMFHRLDASSGRHDPPSEAPSVNPFWAQNHRPEPLSGEHDYFVGSASLTSAGFVTVGNDNYALYVLSLDDVDHVRTIAAGGVVCSSPAISYAVQPGYRWVYIVSRQDGGRLLAYRDQLNP